MSRKIKRKVNMSLDPDVVTAAAEAARIDGFRSLSELTETLLKAHTNIVMGAVITITPAQMRVNEAATNSQPPTTTPPSPLNVPE